MITTLQTITHKIFLKKERKKPTQVTAIITTCASTKKETPIKTRQWTPITKTHQKILKNKVGPSSTVPTHQVWSTCKQAQTKWHSSMQVTAIITTRASTKIETRPGTPTMRTRQQTPIIVRTCQKEKKKYSKNKVGPSSTHSPSLNMHVQPLVRLKKSKTLMQQTPMITTRQRNIHKI